MSENTIVFATGGKTLRATILDPVLQKKILYLRRMYGGVNIVAKENGGFEVEMPLSYLHFIAPKTKKDSSQKETVCHRRFPRDGKVAATQRISGGRIRKIPLIAGFSFF